MEKSTVLEMLRQTSLSEIGVIFREWIRDVTKETIISVMLQEVNELCGGFYHPAPKSEFRRAGSASGKITLNGVKSKIIRPRVRRYSGGKSSEVNLLSYQAAKKGDDVARRILLAALSAGVSARSAVSLNPGGHFGSKSAISRLWISEGLKKIEELRKRELSGESFFCLMLDGIALEADIVAVVAMGITTDGRKLMLDFEIGSSENKEVCDALLNRILNRGFRCIKGARLLVINRWFQSAEKKRSGKI